VQQAAPATPAQPAPPAQAAAPAGPVPISLAQLAYLNPPNPIYPARSRRAGEQGTVMLRVIIDPNGTPVQVTLARSSGHPALDESAISAMRAARIRPLGRLVVVDAPITFNLQ
jgi:protein TonB